jgi:predicted nucleic acid-binding protein
MVGQSPPRLPAGDQCGSARRIAGRHLSHQRPALALLADILLLPVEPAIIEIVETYIQRMVMPRDPTGDALHLALASYHKCDFLLTWNVQHLANANKFAHIRRINVLLDLFTPALVTPLELLA